jgi:anion-transporting  ArsA/GET3 family ATPase
VPARSDDQPLTGARLHVVTGKGGTGKTTVAAALALALTRQGGRVLLAEVEGRQGISQTFDVPPLADEEVRIVHGRHGGELYGLSVDPKTALMEYLQTFYRLGRAGSALERFGAIDFATTIAPGVRDVLLIGKVYEAAGRRSGRRGEGGPPAYDAVVLDAPPTGRVVRFLNVNAEVAGVAKVGPIRSQADSITRMLRSPATAVHVVTLLEEMPVQETVDAMEELRRTSLPLGAIVINQVREPLLAEDELAAVASRPRRLHDGVAKDLSSAGVRPSEAMVAGLLEQGAQHADLVAEQARHLALLEAQGRPLLRLPLLVDGTDSGGIRELADALADQALA